MDRSIEQEKKRILKAITEFKKRKNKEMKHEKQKSFWQGAFIGWGVFMLMFIIYKIL